MLTSLDDNEIRTKLQCFMKQTLLYVAGLLNYLPLFSYLYALTS